ncbi:MAG: peptidoglycan DD-metalloendopeptidase family protein, partial [Gemmatimonadales bacterium]
GERAVEDALPVFAPFTKIGYFDPGEARAVGYRIPALRGQRLIVEIDAEGSDDSTWLFVDLYRQRNNGASTPVHVAAADPNRQLLDFVAYWDGEYVLRVQPELLRGGRYRLAVRNAPSLSFPVSNHDSRAIRSTFGDPRDGGGRSHQGVDIFAPRGTPVVATTAGRVTFVGTNRLGGRVVWLRDSQRGQSFYYAHLDSQVVGRGTVVGPGDTLGLVGNSGNARTTPPHLHFGVYVRGYGAVNPSPYVAMPSRREVPLRADTSTLGQLARVREAGLLFAGPSRHMEVLRELEPRTAVRLLAGVGSWYQVQLPDGTEGFITSSLAESIDRPLRTTRLANATLIRARPWVTAVPKRVLEPGATVSVVARFANYLFVRSEDGTTGWWDPVEGPRSTATAAGGI